MYELGNYTTVAWAAVITFAAGSINVANAAVDGALTARKKKRARGDAGVMTSAAVSCCVVNVIVLIADI